MACSSAAAAHGLLFSLCYCIVAVQSSFLLIHPTLLIGHISASAVIYLLLQLCLYFCSHTFASAVISLLLQSCLCFCSHTSASTVIYLLLQSNICLLSHIESYIDSYIESASHISCPAVIFASACSHLYRHLQLYFWSMSYFFIGKDYWYLQSYRTASASQTKKIKTTYCISERN